MESAIGTIRETWALAQRHVAKLAFALALAGGLGAGAALPTAADDDDGGAYVYDDGSWSNAGYWYDPGY